MSNIYPSGGLLFEARPDLYSFYNKSSWIIDVSNVMKPEKPEHHRHRIYAKSIESFQINIITLEKYCKGESKRFWNKLKAKFTQA